MFATLNKAKFNTQNIRGLNWRRLMLGPLHNLLYKTWTHCTYCLYVRLLTLGLLRAAWSPLTVHVSICYLTKAKTMDTQQPHPLATVLSLNTEKQAAIIPRRRMTES
jgi:hypothetical protein